MTAGSFSFGDLAKASASSRALPEREILATGVDEILYVLSRKCLRSGFVLGKGGEKRGNHVFLTGNSALARFW